MKTKFYVLAALLLTGALNAILAETKEKIYPAEGGTLDKALGYDDKTHIFVSKDKFESAVPGNIVRVHGWNTGDGAHKMLLGYQVCSGTVDENKAYLPGGEKRDITWTKGIGDDQYYDFYLTKDMLDAIRTGYPNCAGSGVGRDFRIYGEGITANVVDLVQPGLAGSFHEPFKTVWKGLLWVDGGEYWNSCDINKATLAPFGDFSNVKAIRFYHGGDHTNYLIKLFKDGWGDGNVIANSEGNPENFKNYANYAELILTDELRTVLKNVTSVLHLQGHKTVDENASFNLTDVVFVTYSPDDCPNCFYVY